MLASTQESTYWLSSARRTVELLRLRRSAVTRNVSSPPELWLLAELEADDGWISFPWDDSTRHDAASNRRSASARLEPNKGRTSFLDDGEVVLRSRRKANALCDLGDDLRWRKVVRSPRETNGERRPLADFADDLESPTEYLDEFPRECEADAGSFVRAGGTFDPVEPVGFCVSRLLD